MLSAQTIRRARRLLAAGELSHRAIARRLQIGRTTVGDIARGKRTEDGSDQIIQRCPRCGNLVETPCRQCNHAPAPRSPSMEDGPADELRLQLKPEHEERYLALFVRRALSTGGNSPLPLGPKLRLLATITDTPAT